MIKLQIKSILTNKLTHLNRLRGFHTFTVKGFLVCNKETSGTITHKFDWKNALIDAGITSAVTFFSTLGAGHAAGLNDIGGLTTALVAALTQFFVFLALKRGIIHQKEN
ncbi:MAG: hypothetical protein JW702_11010 [Clostridiales bacterium]|nr:hypothetical protein [Clostridiales bacterium]